MQWLLYKIKYYITFFLKKGLYNKSNSIYMKIIFSTILTSYNHFGKDGKTDTKNQVVTSSNAIP